MRAVDVLGRLRALRVSAFTTSDAAAAAGLSIEAASHALRRLGAAGVVTPVRKGLWTTREYPDPLTLADYVTAPHPSYVSLQSALHLHGMIEQIPTVTYLVSLGRTAQIRTRVGTFSVHHVEPQIFGVATLDQRTGVRLASPEKALVDFLYLSPARSRLFARLSELELPAAFSRGDARRWAARIPSARLRTIVARELDRLLGAKRTQVKAPERRERPPAARARRPAP
jgi:DNA-binding transcriptional ArsR family regulator